MLASKAMPELTEELFVLFETTGNRLQYENIYFLRRKYLSVFAILAMQYRRERDLQLLAKVVSSVCDERCWALPAHINRGNDPHWEITVDLFAAETAFTLAEIVGKLGKQLPANVCKRATDEVFQRVLRPYMEKQPYAWWENSDMNWNAVCNGSIGGAAIWLMKDAALLEPLLDRICANLQHYVTGFSEDGACLEGFGYFTYGMSFFTAFADMLLKYSGGRRNLFANERLEKIAHFPEVCFFPGGITLSFSDGDWKDTFRVGLMSRLKMQYPEIRLPDFANAAGLESDACYRYLILSRDIFFTKDFLAQERMQATAMAQMRQKGYPQKAQKIACHYLFLQAQWSICKSENGCALAAKGGHNAEPHNHNDVGSFLYVRAGEMILADLGAGEYTAGYFGTQRYEYLCCRALGHNLPLIDGVEQKAGRVYAASAFHSDAPGQITIGIENAYGLADNEKIIRNIQMDMESGCWEVSDCFALQPGRKVTENLLTHWPARAVADGFVITTERQTCRIRTNYGIDFRVREVTYCNHSGEEVKARLLQWEVLEGQEVFGMFDNEKYI